MKKFSDEELSRILGECAAGRLQPIGCSPDEFAEGAPCCVNQAAYVEEGCWVAYHMNPEAAEWFDRAYDAPPQSPVKLLRGLERIGAA